MRIQNRDFIPADYDAFSVWVRDLHAHGSSDSVKKRILTFTTANLGCLKEIGDDADHANRQVLLFEEAYRAAVKYRKDLVNGKDDKELITLAAFNFSGFTDKRAGQKRWLRHLIKKIKLDDGYSPAEDGALLKIVSTDKSYDFNHDQPVISGVLTVGENVLLKVPMQGYPIFRVYSALDEEHDYTWIGNGSNGEFKDPRPFPAKTQKRRYYIFFAKDTAGREEIGLPSDVAKILVQKAG